MAERRMFAKTIVLSDAFLDMPLSARCLYFTLSMLADDDGFVNNWKSIMKLTGTKEDDLKVIVENTVNDMKKIYKKTLNKLISRINKLQQVNFT